MVTEGTVSHFPLLGTTFKLNAVSWADQTDAGNNIYNAETLLHELGHIFSADGFGSQIKYDGPGASGNGKYNN